MKQIGILRYQGSHPERITDYVLEESSIKLSINFEYHCSFNCINEHLEELVYGYLYNSGLIANTSDVSAVNYNNNDASINVLLQKEETSKVVKTKNHNSFNPESIYRIAEIFQNLSDRYRSTGAAHTAALVKDNQIIIWFDDISRHVAIDKLTGACLLQNIDLRDGVLMVSCRVTKTVAEKAVRAGYTQIYSIGAVTDAAIIICQANEIRLIGFIKQSSLSVFA